MNTESRRAAQFLHQCYLLQMSYSTNNWLYLRAKLLTWVKIRELISMRVRTLSTDLQNSQSYTLHSQMCVLNSWTFFFHQLLEMQTPYVLPSPSTNSAVFRRRQRVM